MIRRGAVAWRWASKYGNEFERNKENMKLGMINSAWEQHGIDLLSGLERTKEIGFDCVDIFQDPLDPGADERITAVRAKCDELALPIISVVGVSVGLIDFNPSVQAFHLDRCKRYLDMAQQLGAKNYLLVIGEYIWQKEVIPPAEQWKWGVEHLKTLGGYAAERDLEIVLELEPFDMALVNNLSEMGRFLTDVDVPAVKANIDISHMLLSDSKPEELATCISPIVMERFMGISLPTTAWSTFHPTCRRSRTSILTVPSVSSSNTLRSLRRSSSGSPRPTMRPTSSCRISICGVESSRQAS